MAHALPVRLGKPIAALAAVALLAFPALAQVTNDTIVVGGPGTCGSEGGDPPLLNNGTPASASVRFTYNAATGRLQVQVTNTSPLVGNDPNPLVTQVYFNLPRGAITGIDLVAQTAGAGGATPAFVPSFDVDLGQAPNPNGVGPFGDFNVCLETPGGNIKGGIANAAATVLPGPPGQAVEGPATFTFQMQGPGLSQLSASAFARAVASKPAGGKYLNVVVKFQGGGRGGAGSAWIGDTPDCSPSSFVIGEPCIGHRITFTLAGAPGCAGCLLLTANPTPTPFLSFLIPAGPPYIDLLGGVIGPTSVRTLTVTIPDDPRLVNQTLFYFAVVLENGGLSFTPRHALTICR